MESNAKLVFVALVLLVAIASHPVAAGIGGQAIYCGMTKEGFDACQPSVSISNPIEPTLACCSALADADLSCLCMFKYAKSLLQAHSINPDLAVQLPVKCKLVPSFHC